MARPKLVVVGAPALKSKLRVNRFGVPPYAPGDRCGFCGGTHWHVGRSIAECANPRCRMPVQIEADGIPEHA